jgi:hypothetical protein
VAPSGLAVRRIDERRLVRLANRRKVTPLPGRAEHRPHDLAGGPVRLARKVQKRDLADHGGHAHVLSRGGKRVAATHRGPEGDHPVGVDAVQGADERDRRTPVLELACGLEEIGLSRALAEPAMVEDEGREALRGKSLGEGAQAVASRARQAMGHDHHGHVLATAGGVRARASRIQPCRTHVLSRAEEEVLTIHTCRTCGAAGV